MILGKDRKARTTLAIAIAVLGVAGQASAGTGQGHVGSVLTGRLGYQVFVQLTNATFTSFGCGNPNSGTWQYAFTTQSQGGKDMLATLLWAKATQTQIILVGGGTCSQDAGLEDVSYIITL